MATLWSQVQKVAGDAVGVLGGGRSSVDAQALAAKAALEAQQAKGRILGKLRDFGAKIGPSTGADLFQAIASGAEGPAAAARAQAQEKYLGISIDNARRYGIGAAVVLGLIGVGFLLWRRK